MNRRSWLAGVAALILSGCEKLTGSAKVNDTINKAEGVNKRVQRSLIGRHALAREFQRADISKDFKANGTLFPGDQDYRALQSDGFKDWALVVDGLVETPLRLTMDELRAEPARTQITRHDCVEGWSAIGEWHGARLGDLLNKAKLKPEAKYVVFHCMDTLAADATDNTKGRYYESIDLVDAFHEQTIMAYDMNGAPLPVPHGAPLRLRVERQLGYKQAKYVHRIEAVADFSHIGLGNGGFWEDRGYEWYAGI